MQQILSSSDFTDIYTHEEKDKRFFCYRSGTFVYEEYFFGGRLVAGGFNGAGYPQNVLEELPTHLAAGEHADACAFSLEADGTTLEFDFSFVSFEKKMEERGNASVLHGILTLKSKLLPLTVQVHTVLDGTPMMERWLEVTDHGSSPLGISDLAVFSGGVAEGTNQCDPYFDPQEAKDWFSLGTMQSSMWGCEGLFEWQALPEGALCVSGKYGRDRHRHPAFFLRDNRAGSLYFGQLAYAGGYEFRFDKNTEPNKNGCNSRLSWRFSVTGPRPLLILAPNESFSTPTMHIGMLIGDLDDAVNAMHRHLRQSVFTLPVALGKKGLVEAGIGPEHAYNMETICQFTDSAAELGAEAMILDAGWYCPPGTACKEWGPRTGDWFPDHDLFPDDFRKVRDYIHSKGLLFGLWMEAERIGKASRTFAEHPEYIAPSYITGQTREFVDLTNEDALAFVESEIARVIEEYQVDLFRLDHNTHAASWFTKTLQNGRPACGLTRQVQAVEKLFRRLRQRFPNVVFENCAAGGGRTDIGMVQNFAHTWVSDWNTAPRSIAITNGMTMVLPPEYVDRLVSGMFCHTSGSLDLQVRHTIFGRPTTNNYNPVGSLPNPTQTAFVKHTIDIYKDFIRPYAGKDLIYHHTPEISGARPKGVCILERAAIDQTRSVIGIFHLSGVGAKETRVFPRGIDPGKDYRITFDNSGKTAQVSGYMLKDQGIRVAMDGALQSELLLLEML